MNVNDDGHLTINKKVYKQTGDIEEVRASCRGCTLPNDQKVSMRAEHSIIVRFERILVEELILLSFSPLFFSFPPSPL